MNQPLRQIDDLPRVYSPIRHDRASDLALAAVELAAGGADDATLLYSDSPARIGSGEAAWPTRPGDLAFAVIIRSALEPRQVGQVGLVLATALAQAVARHVSPLTLLQLRWPDTLLLNEGMVGRVWLHPDRPNGAAGDWLVAAAAINIPARSEDEALAFASLVADGGAECDAGALLLDSGRLFLRLLNRWVDSGPVECLTFWNRRLRAPATEAAGECSLDPQGDLLLETAEDRRRLDLANQGFGLQR